MEKVVVKFRTEGKGLPPRPIRVLLPGWGGSAEKKKENGSQPQPWHCPLFVEACTEGFELVYQYDTECHVINENGQVRLEFDPSAEPGANPDDFSLSAPDPPTNYLFATSVDVQVPPGYVVRTEPHPRFYTDGTGTVPVALIGNVKTEWWPKKLFCVFKIPAEGKRHVFRKGEPYAQILIVPQQERELQQMAPEEAARRKALEDGIRQAKGLIAKRVWHNPDGLEFSDHYKVMERAYESKGLAGVEEVVADAVRRHEAAIPKGKSVSEYLELALQHQRAGRYLEAKETLLIVRRLDPQNAEAGNRMAMLGWAMGLTDLALGAMRQAVAMQPTSVQYQSNLGELYRRLGKLEEAEASLRAALQLDPKNAVALSNLGLTLAQQGRAEEGAAACRAAVELQPGLFFAHFRAGMVLQRKGDIPGARAAYEKALSLNPASAEAKKAIESLATQPALREPAAGSSAKT